MVLWHTVDAWTLRTDRASFAFDLVLFAAGWAAPTFLFLAGVSVALAGDARVRNGMDRSAVSRALQVRGWQVFLLAHVFRFQSFLLNPNGSWSSVLKPDILNVLGLGLVLSGWLWKRAPTTASATRWLVLPAAIVVVVLTPLSREWWWPTLLYPRFEAYVRPVGNFGVFPLFPAIGYVLAGAAVGVALAGARVERDRMHRQVGLIGSALLVVGLALSAVPALQVPTAVDSAPSVAWRIGAIMLALWAASALVGRRDAGRWRPLVVLGQTSLFVYWVHVELAYGVFSYPIRQALTLTGSLTLWAVFMVVLTGLAMLWQTRRKGPIIPPHMSVSTLAGARPAR